MQYTKYRNHCAKGNTSRLLQWFGANGTISLIVIKDIIIWVIRTRDCTIFPVRQQQHISIKSK